MEPISVTPPPLQGRAILAQSWCELVFLHWRVEPSEVAPLLPAGVVPDEFDGTSWVGLIPFRMRRTAPLNTVPIPYFGSFVEVNVRLYGVDERGRRGVVFRSLEASRLAAVLGARASFSIPYFWASAKSSDRGSELRYASRRHGRNDPAFSLTANRTTNPVADGPLSEFLTARWRLFGSRRGRTIVMPNTHERWRLFEADVLELHDELVAAAGIRSIAGRTPDSVLYSPGVRTLFGAPERLR